MSTARRRRDVVDLLRARCAVRGWASFTDFCDGAPVVVHPGAPNLRLERRWNHDERVAAPLGWLTVVHPTAAHPTGATRWRGRLLDVA